MLTALLALWTIAVFGLVPSAAEGAVPQLINFQGILKDGSGNPVADGSYSVIFTIYDAAVGGTALWAETTSVSTAGGLFSVFLGSANPVVDSAFNSPNRWLGIKVAADPEMTPRQQLVSVGYAYETAQWTTAGANLFRLNGNVGIGTSSPGAKLTVNDNIANYGVGWPAIVVGKLYGSPGIWQGSDALNYLEMTWNHSFSSYAGIKTGGGQPLTLQESQGNVGIATPGPVNRLDVEGGAAIGAAYSGTNTAPTNGLLVEGPVGIGTSSPSERLTVAGSMEVGTGHADYRHLRIGGGNSSGFLYGSYPFFGDGIHTGYNFYADGISTYRPNLGGSTSRLAVGYGYVGTYVGAGPNFYPNSIGFYINGVGNVGLGLNNPFARLVVDGFNGAHATSFPTSSDIRLKENIEPLTHVLDKIENIRGVSFDWDDTGEDLGRSPGRREIGVIAQDVEKVFPELISQWGDEKYRGLDYGRMAAVLIEAFKELRAENKELKTLFQKLIPNDETTNKDYTLQNEPKGGK